MSERLVLLLAVPLVLGAACSRGSEGEQVISSSGCINALDVSSIYAGNGDADLSAHVRNNLEAALKGRIQGGRSTASWKLDAIERVCQQTCAIWAESKNQQEREKLINALVSCLHLAMSHAAQQGGKATAPVPEATRVSTSEQPAKQQSEPEMKPVPLELGGVPKKNGAGADKRVVCRSVPGGFEAEISGRSAKSKEFVGCCVDLPQSHALRWTVASVHVAARSPEQKLDVKLENGVGDRPSTKAAYLHNSDWSVQEDDVTRGLPDLEGDPVRRLCALAVGPNKKARKNTITVTNLRVGQMISR